MKKLPRVSGCWMNNENVLVFFDNGVYKSYYYYNGQVNTDTEHFYKLIDQGYYVLRNDQILLLSSLCNVDIRRWFIDYTRDFVLDFRIDYCDFKKQDLVLFIPRYNLLVSHLSGTRFRPMWKYTVQDMHSINVPSSDQINSSIPSYQRDSDTKLGNPFCLPNGCIGILVFILLVGFIMLVNYLDKNS